jgi:hypothetical protein
MDSLKVFKLISNDFNQKGKGVLSKLGGNMFIG